MEKQELDLIQIFLENPGGLRFNELWSIVDSRGIYAKQTLIKRLKKLVDQGLIEKYTIDHYTRYTIGLTELVSQKIMANGYTLPEQAEGFLKSLYGLNEKVKKEHTVLLARIGSAYLARELTRSLYWPWLLFPFLFDKKVREIWFLSYKYSMNLLFEKYDELGQKLLGGKISTELSKQSVQEKFLTPELKTLQAQIEEKNKLIPLLIEQLDVEDYIKKDLRTRAGLQ